MKRAIFAGCLAAALLFTLAAALLTPAVAEPEGEPAGETAQRAPRVPSAAPETAAEPETLDGQTELTVLCGGEVRRVALDEYLTGVVLGEMPPSFADAALEAQAIAARTFALRRCGAPKHPQADVCADGRCCQQYLDAAQIREKLGDQAAACREKAAAAVAATDGLVLTYDGALIDAVYFSSSGGSTESAAAVWGGDVPYLQPVESPGEESRYDTDTVRVDAAAFRDRILQEAPGARLEGAPAGWFGGVVSTAGRGVETLEIGGEAFSGTALRRLFALRSTRFTVSVEGDDIVFTTHGNGHRVGMSQYGAQAMATAGADAREILTHYYTGVEIVRFDEL